MKKRTLKITEDGSHTLYVPEINEHYHSTHGAIQESQHVYIESGFNACSKQNVNILEIGFGTGLNALLSYRASLILQRNVFYQTTELFPLRMEEVSAFNYPASAEEAVFFEKIHTCEWERPIEIAPNFVLCKQNRDVSSPKNLPTDTRFDVVYFDAFAPEKQSEMWSQAIFDQLFSICNEGAIVTTYCAKGEVRRRMQSAGFSMERLPGPPGKREILRGKK